MPLGKICWILWFSSMITRILRRWPRPAAGLEAELAVGDPAAPVGAGAVAVFGAAVVAVGVVVPGAEEQPTNRAPPASTAPARAARRRKGPVSGVRRERLRACLLIAPTCSSRRV